jgi:hypothetical protein
MTPKKWESQGSQEFLGETSTRRTKVTKKRKSLLMSISRDPILPDAGILPESPFRPNRRTPRQHEQGARSGASLRT